MAQAQIEERKNAFTKPSVPPPSPPSSVYMFSKGLFGGIIDLLAEQDMLSARMRFLNDNYRRGLFEKNMNPSEREKYVKQQKERLIMLKERYALIKKSYDDLSAEERGVFMDHFTESFKQAQVSIYLLYSISIL